MVKVTDKNYSMDGYLVKNLDFAIERIKHKHDFLIIIDGDEGSGKSTFGKGIGYYLSQKLNTTFEAEQIFFEMDKMFDYAINNTKKVIIWDEAGLGGMGEDWQNSQQKKLIKLLITCRKYNHSFIFIIPKIRTLRGYLAVDRSLALLRVYSPDKIKRGYFRSFGKNKKEQIYRLEGRGQNSYFVKPDFFGRFVDVTGKLIDEKVYEKNKDDAIQSIGEDKKKISKREEKYVDKRKKALKYLNEKVGVSKKDLCLAFDTNPSNWVGISK